MLSHSFTPLSDTHSLRSKDMSSREDNGESSRDTSHNASQINVAGAAGKTKEKKRVGFLNDQQSQAGPVAASQNQDDYFSMSPPQGSRGGTPGDGPLDSPGNRDSFNRAELTSALEKILQPEHHLGPLPFPRPALRKQTVPEHPTEALYDQPLRSEVEARNRANRLAISVESANQSRTSIDLDEYSPGALTPAFTADPILDDELDGHAETSALTGGAELRQRRGAREVANDLVRTHTRRRNAISVAPSPGYESGARSGTATPVAHDLEYVPRPQKYRGGILGSLLKLYNQDEKHTSSGESSAPGTPLLRTPNRTPNRTPRSSPPGSSPTTPRFDRPSTPRTERPRTGLFALRNHHSASTLAELIGSSTTLAAPASSRDMPTAVSEKLKQEREREKQRKAKKDKRGSWYGGSAKARAEDEYKITKHIAEILSRHRYLVKLCRALMMYGAPTHRLEAYMAMSARVLGIEGQFLYLPGCMIISFDDSSTHTTEVKIVRAGQGVDLGRLRDCHEIYKEVVHDLIGVDEATRRVDELMTRKDKFPKWMRVIFYGFAAVCVAPFAFEGRWIDLPIAFLLGCILGILQLVLAPSNELYSNVFEITAAIITSFLSRAFGSIRNGELFCFSALAQSSIALILPGYIVLCSSLELQSHNIVSGSVRMVYALIYTLFLGYGITIGSVLYGYMDDNATSSVHCTNPLNRNWYLLFVPLFTLCLCVVNQAKWKQTPVMLFISFAGYCVNSYSSTYFQGSSQISNTLGAMTIGVLANLYSRLGRHVENFALDLWEYQIEPRVRRFRRGSKIHEPAYPLGPYSSDYDVEQSTEDLKAHTTTHIPRQVGYGLAAAAMLPAIFVQVPSGLAAGGSLLSGVTSADQITRNETASSTSSTGDLNDTAFTVLYSVIQVAISISVGLSIAALIVYPLGKRRSGLFSF